MSRFIQNYNQHLSEAEQADDSIILTQLAGRPTWVLATESRVRDTQTATDYLSAVLMAIVHDSALAEGFPHALASAMPWVSFLPDEDRKVFAEEAAEVLYACASISRYTAFAKLIGDWQATAEVWSHPNLARSLSDPVDEPLDLVVDTD